MRRSLLLLAFLISLAPAHAKDTALADYVHHDDGAYSYQVTRVLRNPVVNNRRVLADVYMMHLVSQEWKPTTDLSTGFQSDRELWEHEVAVIVPNTIRSTTASLYITGGYNFSRLGYLDTFNPGSDGFNGGPDAAALVGIAEATGSVVTILRQIPNQTIQFNNDPRGGPRQEDDIIAKSIRNFIDGNGEENNWPVLFPMVKSAVRAMDMTQEFIATNPRGLFSNSTTSQVKDFVVSGASKRGWTTWLTGAVDNRVKAMVPIVFDALDLPRQLENQRAIYSNSRVTSELTIPDSEGAQYSGALRAYVNSPSSFTEPDMNLPVDFKTPAGQTALSRIDPYAYRDRYTMPKYIVNSAGDEFFAVNSSQFYFDDLPGDKYVWYIPNTTHGIVDNPDAAALFSESYMAFTGAIQAGEILPEYRTELLNGGRTIRVEFLNGLLPDDISLWYNDGFNGEPDFRRSVFTPGLPNFREIKSSWFTWNFGEDDRYSLDYLGDGIFEATANDDSHWQAFMLQFVYGVKSVPFLDPLDPSASWRDANFRFSSGISIVGPEELVYIPPTTDADPSLAKTSAFVAVPELSSSTLLALAFPAVAVAAHRRRR